MLTKLKDRLTESLGVFGAILYLIFSIIYFCFPLRALGFHIIVNILLIGAMLRLPILGDLLRHVLWIWSLVVVIGGGFSLPFTIVYYIFFILYCCTELIPFLLGIFGVVLQWIGDIIYRRK